jgi:hypothetical protein
VSTLIPSSIFPAASYSCGLVRCSVEEASRELLSSWWVELGHDPIRDQTDLAELLTPTNQGGPGRVAFIPLKDGWTIYTDNVMLGADPAGILWSWARQGYQALDASSKSSSDQYNVSLVVYETDDPPSVRRTISCSRDYNNWEFSMEGEPFGFEEVAAYTRRVKRERFTPEMLERYLLALGVPPLNATNIDFPGALILENLSKPSDRRIGIHPDMYKHGIYPPSDWVRLAYLQ